MLSTKRFTQIITGKQKIHKSYTEELNKMVTSYNLN